MFLHCPGANDTFGADDVDYKKLKGARIFHFGYPPIMRRMYRDGGRELEKMFRRVKALGITTSLDMTMIDPQSEAGRVDWRALLHRVLPHVDVFLPSLDEMQLMLQKGRMGEWGNGGMGASSNVAADVRRRENIANESASLRRKLRDISDELLAMGCAIVGLKLGDQGLYVSTTSDAKRLANIKLIGGIGVPPVKSKTKVQARPPSHHSENWLNRELHAPCFKVEVVGTTGSGDCTIAGFLAGLLKGLPLEEVMTAAVAVGACCCENPDATSGIIPWSAVQKRIKQGWARL
jgi:sugar/nucleoside kinase (ribokinase family)